jgi:DNA-binding response OmpR family regulator
MAYSLSHARRAPDIGSSAPPAALVICVAGSATDRARLSALVDDDVSLLMVSSADEVLGILRGIAPRDVTSDDAIVVLPQLRLDSDRRVASWFGDEVDLTPLEYVMLACLLSRPGRMWSFEALYERVWRTTYLGNRTEIHSLVKRLRSKLRQLNNSLAIEAIRGVGFRLVLPAQ